MKRVPAAAVPVFAVLGGLPTLLLPESVVAQVGYDIAFILLLTFAWLGVLRARSPARPAYALIAAALTVWFAGDLLYSALIWRYGELGEVSAADVLWVAGYPLVAAGMVLMARLRSPGQLREAALDALAMTVVVATLVWQFMVSPSLGDGLSWGVLITAFYPFGDVLLFAAGALVVLSRGRRGAPTRYLLTALTITFAGDVIISTMSLIIPNFDTAQLDLLLLLANGMFAAALWHPDARMLTDAPRPGRERLHPARVVFLGVSLLALPALEFMRSKELAVDRFAMLAAMLLLTVIVLIRFTLVVRQQERTSDALAYRASHDELTGTTSRQELHAQLTAALLHGAPTVHFLDLNGFKPINDRYGHAAGDFVLIAVAARLRAAVRACDTVARFGGDEFVVLSDAAVDAEVVTERLRAAVTAPLRYRGHDLNLGVSIGHASATGAHQHTGDSLLAEADAGMYRDKGSRPAVRSSQLPALAADEVTDPCPYRPTGHAV